MQVEGGPSTRDPRDPLGFYAALGLRPGASLAEVRRAWRRLAREAHPDAGGDPDRFRLLQEAYGTLSDPLRRIAYDRLAGDAPAGGEEVPEPSSDPGPRPRRRPPERARPVRLLAAGSLLLVVLAAGSWVVLRGSGRHAGPERATAGAMATPPAPPVGEAAERPAAMPGGETGVRVLYAASLGFEPGSWRLERTRPPFRETVLEGLAAALGPVVERGWWIEVEATSPRVAAEDGVALDGWELALARLATVLDALLREGVPGERLGVRFTAGAAAEFGTLGSVERRLLCCRGERPLPERLSAEPVPQDDR